MTAIVLNASPPNGDITCQTALLVLMPCKPYLESSGPPTPSVFCCKGVQNVTAQATTTEIRRSLCECFKQAAASMSIDPKKLKQLPQFCQVSVPVPLDPSIDCSKISLF
ncbi:non-specific lipid-transfer protein AP10-like [Rosa rugosa]|uniref:non-specific lipid-transfer protein AP10-like n=1 Tax=Rosa rugosa TaxID=74645 RepID=UPI002B403F6A|nr:non-specific lipid-transfer protein AP10-like [Rosa rugosa]